MTAVLIRAISSAKLCEIQLGTQDTGALGLENDISDGGSVVNLRRDNYCIM